MSRIAIGWRAAYFQSRHEVASSDSSIRSNIRPAQKVLKNHGSSLFSGNWDCPKVFGVQTVKTVEYAVSTHLSWEVWFLGCTALYFIEDDGVYKSSHQMLENLSEESIWRFSFGRFQGLLRPRHKPSSHTAGHTLHRHIWHVGMDDSNLSLPSYSTLLRNHKCETVLLCCNRGHFWFFSYTKDRFTSTSLAFTYLAHVSSNHQPIQSYKKNSQTYSIPSPYQKN